MAKPNESPARRFSKAAQLFAVTSDPAGIWRLAQVGEACLPAALVPGAA